jgi:hypothetical protein
LTEKLETVELPVVELFRVIFMALFLLQLGFAWLIETPSAPGISLANYRPASGLLAIFSPK